MKTLLLLLALAVPAFAQVTPATPAGVTTGAGGAGTGVGVGAPGAGAKTKGLSAGDKKFVKDALESMFYEMSLAGKAKTESKLEGTKAVANTLKEDLDKVWADVGTIASAHDEKIPMELAGGDKSKAERLGKAGDKFDKEFLKIVGTEAGKLAKTFEAAAKSGSDPEVKRVAGMWAPTLKEHVGKIDTAEKEAAKAK